MHYVSGSTRAPRVPVGALADRREAHGIKRWSLPTLSGVPRGRGTLHAGRVLSPERTAAVSGRGGPAALLESWVKYWLKQNPQVLL